MIKYYPLGLNCKWSKAAKLTMLKKEYKLVRLLNNNTYLKLRHESNRDFIMIQAGPKNTSPVLSQRGRNVSRQLIRPIHVKINESLLEYKVSQHLNNFTTRGHHQREARGSARLHNQIQNGKILGKRIKMGKSKKI